MPLAISGAINRNLNTTQASAAQLAKTGDPEKKSSAGELQRESKSQMNAQIVQTTLSLSVKSSGGALSLLYRATTNNIQESLDSAGKTPAAGQVAGQPDISAEATATRILSFATGFFDAYAKQNPGKDPDELAAKFVSIVRGGFEKGYNEAKKILDGMGMLGGSAVEKDIQKTFDLVMKGFDNFLAAKSTPATATAASSAASKIN